MAFKIHSPIGVIFMFISIKMAQLRIALIQNYGLPEPFYQFSTNEIELCKKIRMFCDVLDYVLVNVSITYII